MRIAHTILSLVVVCASCKGSNSVAQVWLTTPDQSKLLNREKDIPFTNDSAASRNIIDVDDTKQFQEMVGFGASITDASAFLIQSKLSPAARDSLMRELFSRESGIGLSFTRLTIGASDFSQTHYSLDDVPAGQTDTGLTRFSIEPNRAYVLPVVKQALAINPDLKVMASPWSAPAWMKTTNSLIKGTLKPEAFAAFAEYFRKYIQAYSGESVPIYAITVNNEPHFEPDNYPGMRLEPRQRAKFVGENLGPLFARSGIRTKIFDLDHNWDLYKSPLEYLADTTARKYTDAVAWHCYGGDVAAQDSVHDAFPDKDAYFTECSGGEWSPKFGDNLKFTIGRLVIGSVRNWSKGVLLWNLALDENHGPHLGGCGDCRGVVTISSNGTITRNVEYYALAHASRFVRPGARRIESTSGADSVETVAFRNPDESNVLIALNASGVNRRFTVQAKRRFLQYDLPAGAVVTMHWN